MNGESIFILLFVVATGVAIAGRWLRLPYTVALVLAGLALGSVRLFPAPELTRTLLFSIFLPGLVFEAAFHIDFQEFWRNRATITSLAVPGVFASIILTVAVLTPAIQAMSTEHGFGWQEALVFGALIAATDPIAVIAIFRTLGVPRRLSVLLEGESLLNDGTGIVFFSLSLALVAGGTSIGVGSLATQFISVVGIGAVIGGAVGLLASLLIRHVDDPMIEITLTTIAAYGSFVAADELAYSGIIATVAAGMVCGNIGARTGMSASTRVAAETFWEYVTFALNSVVFLLIGLEVHISTLLSSWLEIVAAYIVITIARSLVILTVWGTLGATRERFPANWAVVLAWGGLRGALPMVLVLGLPAQFPYRSLLVSMTFGVVILSILLHGLSMSPVLKMLRIVHDADSRRAYELKRARLLAVRSALDEIDRRSRLRAAEPEVLDTLRDEYQHIAQQIQKEMTELSVEGESLRIEELYRTRSELLQVEKQAVLDAYRYGKLSRTGSDQLIADLDARLLRVDSAVTADLTSRAVSERDDDHRPSTPD